MHAQCTVVYKHTDDFKLQCLQQRTAHYFNSSHSAVLDALQLMNVSRLVFYIDIVHTVVFFNNVSRCAQSNTTYVVSDCVHLLTSRLGLLQFKTLFHPLQRSKTETSMKRSEEPHTKFEPSTFRIQGVWAKYSVTQSLRANFAFSLL
jgi:hypothetical protein